MKKIIIKYISIIIIVVISAIIYLSSIGLETKKFNNQIRNKVVKVNNKLDLELKKIKLTLDPFNFMIDAQTVGAKIIYQKKVIELESLKTQISLSSLIKNRFVSSSLNISTKSVKLKDLIAFVRAINNKPELFFLERMIKRGYVILDIDLDIDENGKLRDNYEIKGLLRNGKIDFLRNNNLEKINFSLNIKKDIFNFQDINFKTNDINFLSKNLKVAQNKKEFFFEGDIKNKDSTLNSQLANLLKLKFKNINFDSKNNFSFSISDKFKLKNLAIDSEIKVNDAEYLKPDFFKEYLSNVREAIYFKNHNIKVKYKKNYLSLKGFGKVKLENEFDEIEYLISNKDKDFKLDSNIKLSELNLDNLEFLKKFFPNLNKNIILKDNKIEINYSNNDLLLKGSGKIRLDEKYDEIDYLVLKTGKKLTFDTKLNLENILLNVDYLNYKKDKNLKTLLKIKGTYEKNNQLNFEEISILAKDNKIILKDLLLDKDNKIVKIDKLNFNYFDFENKKNQFILQRKNKNNYELMGSSFNANSLISDLLKAKDNVQSKIFKNNINLKINLMEVYLDNRTTIKNLDGNLIIKDNKIFLANLVALFNDDENLSFTITKNDNNEKITTFFSSRAKPLVKRYKFIKGFEEGYLDFYSVKKDKVSQSTLKIYNFKLQKLPTLTKLLTLASLQGIADTLSGEGIRFDEFEMNFTNRGGLMTIDELYAIGPAISILMSGYVETDKLISLRGTLVPATTINKTISTIPFLGKILVGNKTGEGVFGVSFKIKGPPKNLETNVNPIKTLTPRFITRTMEKIKKN